MAAPVTEANLGDPIVRHMRTDPARLRVDLTVGEALAIIRQSPPPARIVYFYVVFLIYCLFRIVLYPNTL